MLSVGGAFLSGEGSFPLRDNCGDLSFWLGGGAFLEEGDLFFFFWGGSPLFGENKAFMAEPSDWPGINHGMPEELKM